MLTFLKMLMTFLKIIDNEWVDYFYFISSWLINTSISQKVYYVCEQIY